MKFNINTLGCKVNNYESEVIKEQLENAGFFYDEEKPDICIINTCSVTNQADHKSMKIIRQMKKNYPEAIIVVCGCTLENKAIDLTKIPADIIIGNHDKSKLVEYINEFNKSHHQIIKFYNLMIDDFESMTIKNYKSKTRAFVKIQDGCNNYCSYCIIPYVRGRSRSKDYDETINEIKKLTNNHQEIVLTGIHTGSYKSNNKDLEDLIHEISKIEELKRIRISSIEITELTDKFMMELTNNQKICNHLHIPLQSGSDSILKAMNRKYNLDYFQNTINKIREIRPDINITTDLIVGFPGEEEQDFESTINFIKKIEFSKIHVFPYSLREGTKASLMVNQISSIIKKERVRIVTKLSNDLEFNYAHNFIGKTLEVLIENSSNESHGHTDNYLEIFIKNKLNYNQIYNVEITEIIDKKIYGVVK